MPVALSGRCEGLQQNATFYERYKRRARISRSILICLSGGGISFRWTRSLSLMTHALGTEKGLSAVGCSSHHTDLLLMASSSTEPSSRRSAARRRRSGPRRTTPATRSGLCATRRFEIWNTHLHQNLRRNMFFRFKRYIGRQREWMQRFKQNNFFWAIVFFLIFTMYKEILKYNRVISHQI